MIKEGGDNMSENQTFVTPVQLSKMTGQRPQAVYNLIRQGYIKAEKRPVVDQVTGDEVGSRWLIEAEVAETYAKGYKTRKATRSATS
jgi:hypothetical protein